MKGMYYETSHYAIFTTFSHFLTLNPNILLSTLFLNTVNVCSSLNIRDQFSYQLMDISKFRHMCEEFSHGGVLPWCNTRRWSKILKIILLHFSAKLSRGSWTYLSFLCQGCPSFIQVGHTERYSKKRGSDQSHISIVSNINSTLQQNKPELIALMWKLDLSLLHKRINIQFHFLNITLNRVT